MARSRPWLVLAIAATLLVAGFAGAQGASDGNETGNQTGEEQGNESAPPADQDPENDEGDQPRDGPEEDQNRTQSNETGQDGNQTFTDDNETNGTEDNGTFTDDNETFGDDNETADGEDGDNFTANGCEQTIVQSNEQTADQDASTEGDADQESAQTSEQQAQQTCVIEGDHTTFDIDEENNVVHNVTLVRDTEVIIQRIAFSTDADLVARTGGTAVVLESDHAHATFVDAEQAACSFTNVQETVRIEIRQELTVERWDTEEQTFVEVNQTDDNETDDNQTDGNQTNDTEENETANESLVVTQDSDWARWRIQLDSGKVLVFVGAVDWNEEEHVFLIDGDATCFVLDQDDEFDQAILDDHIHAQVFVDNDVQDQTRIQIDRNVRVTNVQVTVQQNYQVTGDLQCDCPEQENRVFVFLVDTNDFQGDLEAFLGDAQVQRVDSVQAVLQHQGDDPVYFVEDGDRDNARVVLSTNQFEAQNELRLTAQAAQEEPVGGDGTTPGDGNDTDDGVDDGVDDEPLEGEDETPAPGIVTMLAGLIAALAVAGAFFRPRD